MQTINVAIKKREEILNIHRERNRFWWNRRYRILQLDALSFKVDNCYSVSIHCMFITYGIYNVFYWAAPRRTQCVLYWDQHLLKLMPNFCIWVHTQFVQWNTLLVIYVHYVYYVLLASEMTCFFYLLIMSTTTRG